MKSAKYHYDFIMREVPKMAAQVDVVDKIVRNDNTRDEDNPNEDINAWVPKTRVITRRIHTE